MIDWLAPVLVLAGGLSLGALLLAGLSRVGRARRPEGGSADLRNLGGRRDALVGQLREMEDTVSRWTEAPARERYRLELELAGVLASIDTAAAPSPRSKQGPRRSGAKRDAPRAPAADGAAASPPERETGIAPRRRGILLPAAGSAVVVGVLVLFVARAARPRAEGDLVTGDLPRPAASPSNAIRPAVPDGEEERVHAALAADPGDLEAHLDLARVHLARREMRSVWKETAYVLARSPGHPRALSYQALVHLAMGRADIARDTLVKVVASAPDLIEAYRYLALVDIRSGRDADADATLEAAARRYPDRADDLAAFAREARRSRGQVRARVTVELDRAFRGTATPAGVLFVIVRAAGIENGPPVAVKRIDSANFPLTVAIDDSDSMAGAAIPRDLRIEARLDADGDPLTRSASDLSARIDGVNRDDGPIRLVLTR